MEFFFNLAGHLGKSIEEILELSNLELELWLDFWFKGRFGEAAADARHGIQCAVIANGYSKKANEPTKYMLRRNKPAMMDADTQGHLILDHFFPRKPPESPE